MTQSNIPQTDTSVTSRVSVALANVIDQRAHALGKTRSEIIREILEVAFATDMHRAPTRTSAPPPRKISEPMLRIRIPASLVPEPIAGETRQDALKRALAQAEANARPRKVGT